MVPLSDYQDLYSTLRIGRGGIGLSGQHSQEIFLLRVLQEYGGVDGIELRCYTFRLTWLFPAFQPLSALSLDYLVGIHIGVENSLVVYIHVSEVGSDLSRLKWQVIQVSFGV